MTTFHASYWSPLTWVSFMLDYELWGLDPAGFHLQNLLLHALAVVLLYLVLARMTAAVWRSALVAGIFAVHPIHVEAVAWITERKELLSSVFWMLALGAYLFYTRAPSWRRYLLIVSAMALGLMSKPTLVTLPAILLLTDYWPLRRLRSLRELGSRALEKVPLAVLSLASALTTSYAAREAIVPLSTLGIDARLANAVLAYPRYLRLFLWPVDLAAFYPHAGAEVVSVAEPVAAVLFLPLVTAIVGRYANRFPYLLMGWLWFLVTLLPVIGLMQVGDQAIADRFLHIPSIGLSILIVWGLADLLGRLDVRARLAAGGAAALLLTLGAATRLQAEYWRDSIAVHRRAIEVTGGAFLSHYNLAQALATAGRLEEAEAHYRASVRYDPSNALAYANLGLCYVRLNRPADALESLHEALRLEPANAVAHQNLGLLHAAQGRPDEAIRQFREVIELDPMMEDAHFNLALAYQSAGRPDDAARVLEEALRLGKEGDVPAELLSAVRRAAAIAESERSAATNSRTAP
jgi:tetratricopeptide (TPR) repeat protein